MQATVRKTRFGINRMALALVTAGVLTSTIAGAAVILTGGSGDEARSAPHDAAVVAPAQRPMERGGGSPWQHSVSWAGASSGTEALEANGLPVAPVVNRTLSNGTDYLEANGLPIAPAVAPDVQAAPDKRMSDRAN